MPIVIAQAIDLRALGAIIDVEISPVASVIQATIDAGGAVPAPIKMSAQIDTGASRSVIQTGIAQKLGLRPVGVKFVHTASALNFRCERYSLRVTYLPTSGLMVPVTFNATFTEAPLRGKNFQCLIGRDFLAKAVFTYIGPTNSFVLSL